MSRDSVDAEDRDAQGLAVRPEAHQVVERLRGDLERLPGVTGEDDEIDLLLIGDFPDLGEDRGEVFLAHGIPILPEADMDVGRVQELDDGFAHSELVVVAGVYCGVKLVRTFWIRLSSKRFRIR